MECSHRWPSSSSFRHYFCVALIAAFSLWLLLFKLLLFLQNSRAGGCAGVNYPFLTQKERDIGGHSVVHMSSIDAHEGFVKTHLANVALGDVTHEREPRAAE